MNRYLSSALMLGSLIAAGPAWAQSVNETQTITISQKIKIPGAVLKAGDYTFSVEDRLQDRAIVRITSQDQNKHFLILTVPNAKLAPSGTDGLVRFTTARGKDEALRGWACPKCSPGLEFVYPKAEAAKLTDETAEPVLAVDPTYDKLPANLTPDDMKVVTLWLLAPETITASNKGKGVKGEKWAAEHQSASTSVAVVTTPESAPMTSEVAQAPSSQALPATNESKPANSPDISSAPSAPNTAQASAPVAAVPSPVPAAVKTPQSTEMASAHLPGSSSSRLPKTAGDDYSYLGGGALLIMLAAGSRLWKRSAIAAE